MVQDGTLTREHRIQRRVGVISAAACFAVVLLNISVRAVFPGWPIRTILIHPNVWLFFVLGIVSYITGQIDKIGFRLVQVCLFFLVGMFTILWNSSQDMTGQVFVVIGVLLASQYNLLRDRLGVKLILIFSSVLVAGIASTLIKKETGIYNAIGSFVGSVGLLLVFWAIFSEDIRELMAENRQLLKSAESNRSFATVGQNVSGLVHNFKGITQGLENYSYLLEKASRESGQEKLAGYAEKIREGVGALTRRIDNILLAVRARTDTEAREVEVNRLIESIIELFNTIPEFKHNLTIRLSFAESITLRSNPNECSQMFENVVRNAWEATIERRKRAEGLGEPYYGELEITTARQDGLVRVSFRDNGIGMEACERCAAGGCLECPHWSLGKTTKEGGTGFGMVYIVDRLRAQGGRLEVVSRQGVGTEIGLFLREHD